jgi:hypothetical protein
MVARLLTISRRTKARVNYTISGRHIIYLCTKFLCIQEMHAALSIPKCKVHFNSLRKKGFNQKTALQICGLHDTKLMALDLYYKLPTYNCNFASHRTQNTY